MIKFRHGLTYNCLVKRFAGGRSDTSNKVGMKIPIDCPSGSVDRSQCIERLQVKRDRQLVTARSRFCKKRSSLQPGVRDRYSPIDLEVRDRFYRIFSVAVDVSFLVPHLPPERLDSNPISFVNPPKVECL